ncbi:MAG TPA: tripartite tricarboxylate transporter substrate binding protein [Burkholderiales bacterium]|nr:tripartite tricarboxylate transporter substrate binding protein [Burkholderiales bacterium]
MRLTPAAFAAIAVATWLARPIAHAAQSDYPVKPVRLIVPYPPGGGNDTVARIIAAKLTELWSQQIIIDNRPGANGIVACEIAASAAPDGYTLLVANIGTNAINGGLYKKLPYDPVKSYTPASLLGTTANILVVQAASPVNSVSELVALAKRQPGKLTYSSNGIGSSQHLAGAMMNMAFGIDIVHVPYRGTGPAMVALMANDVSMSFANSLAAMPHVQAGRLKAVGVTSLKRLAVLPEVPAIAESSPGFNAISWWGIVAPAGTPKAIAERISASIRQGLNAPPVSDQLHRQGVEPRPMTPDEFRQFMETELVKWTKVAKASGATAD